MYKVGLSIGVLALLSMEYTKADDDDHHAWVQHANDDDDHCNHQCAAACAANGDDDDCFEDCGCEEHDGKDDLDEVTKSYAHYQAAHRYY
jgi:hypothetical protein